MLYDNFTSVTIQPLLPGTHWKANGTNYFRIRITLHRRSRWLKTNIAVRKEDIGRDGRLRSREMQRELDAIVRRMEDAVRTIDSYDLADMTVDDIVEVIEKRQQKTFRLDFFAYGFAHIATKGESVSKGYASALNALREFVGSDTLDIGDITSSRLRRFEVWLRQKHGDYARAVSSYTAAIRYIHNRAREEYNDEETGYAPIRNPYLYYKPPTQRPVAHRAVEMNLVEKMLAERKSLAGRERMGVDVFLISFALMGMNAPDLYGCASPRGGILTYHRQKTRRRRADHAEMHVRLDPLVTELFREYQSKTRAFRFAETYSSYKTFGANVNKGLARFCERVGHPRITLYQARHTWSSEAYRRGVDKGVVHDCLCHVDKTMKVTDIYIAKDWSVLWDANHKVLEQFQWP